MMAQNQLGSKLMLDNKNDGQFKLSIKNGFVRKKCCPKIGNPKQICHNNCWSNTN